MISVKGAGGGGKKEGLYVWKKYEYTPQQTVTNPTIAINVTNDAITITDSNFDLKPLGTELNQLVTNFFADFTNNGSQPKFLIVSDTLRFNYSSSSFEGIASFDGTTFTLKNSANHTGTFNLSYAGEKVLSEEKYDFLDYIVSDNPNAYPDKALQDGYWYERVVEGVDLLSATGYTKMAVDTITMSSNHSIGANIPHSLGAKPEIVMLIANDSITMNNGVQKLLSIASFESSDALAYGGVTYYSTSSGKTRVNGGGLGEKTYLRADLIAFNSVNYYLQAGKQYTLITMA